MVQEEPDPSMHFTCSVISNKAKRPSPNDVGTGVQYPAWELMARGTTLLHRRDTKPRAMRSTEYVFIPPPC